MYNAVHHYGTGLLSSVLECFPGEALHHGSDAAGVAIVSCHESSRCPLDSFYLLDVQQTIICKETGLGVDFGRQVVDVCKE